MTIAILTRHVKGYAEAQATIGTTSYRRAIRWNRRRSDVHNHTSAHRKLVAHLRSCGHEVEGLWRKDPIHAQNGPTSYYWVLNARAGNSHSGPPD